MSVPAASEKHTASVSPELTASDTVQPRIGAFFSARENTQPAGYFMRFSFHKFSNIVYHTIGCLSILFRARAEKQEKG